MQNKLQKKPLSEYFSDFPQEMNNDGKAAASFMKGRFVSLYKSVRIVLARVVT